jgi:hypothetical protein
MGWDPRDYGQRRATGRSVSPNMMHRGGSFDPKGFVVEPVSCNAKMAGEATTPIAQAISIQANCADQYRQYLDQLDAQRDGDPRALADPRARAQHEHQRRAFGTTEAARFATERAPKVAADRAAQAEARLEQSLAGLRQDGHAATETRRTRQWDSVTRLLDSQTPGEAVATAARLLDNASTPELSVLCEQLPAYLESKGLDGGWILPALTRRSEISDVATEVVNARKAKAIVDSNAARLRQGISEGHAPYAALLDAAPFDPDAVVSQ